MYFKRILVVLLAALVIAAGTSVVTAQPAQAAPSQSDVRWFEQHWFYGTVVHLSNSGTLKMGEGAQDLAWAVSWTVAGGMGSAHTHTGSSR